MRVDEEVMRKKKNCRPGPYRGALEIHGGSYEAKAASGVFQEENVSAWGGVQKKSHPLPAFPLLTFPVAKGSHR